jgi:hypothetical protein
MAVKRGNGEVIKSAKLIADRKDWGKWGSGGEKPSCFY